MTSEYERIRAEDERFVEAFDRSSLTAAPLTGIAILACMHARIDVEDALGLRVGDAHIIRNAGGFATQDAVRSLVVSQQLLGTREVLVIAHTGCGLHGADEAVIRWRVATTTHRETDLVFGAFRDLDAMVREQVRILRSHPALLDMPVHGMVYEVETGRLRMVEMRPGGTVSYVARVNSPPMTLSLGHVGPESPAPAAMWITALSGATSRSTMPAETLAHSARGDARDTMEGSSCVVSIFDPVGPRASCWRSWPAPFSWFSPPSRPARRQRPTPASRTLWIGSISGLGRTASRTTHRRATHPGLR